jgi:phosphate transport system protein
MADNGSGTRSEYRESLQDLRGLVLEMGTLVETMLGRAMEALINRDVPLAQEIRRRDDAADDLDSRIEELGTRLLALQQPMARDLREIGSALRIATDLERIGDYSRDIAGIARRLGGEPFHWPLEDIPDMGEKAGHLIRLATRAFLNADAELAAAVITQDEEIDTVWHRLRDQLIAHMQDDPRRVPQATQLLFVARYLERIGDHATNVAERVIYIETGELPRSRDV